MARHKKPNATALLAARDRRAGKAPPLTDIIRGTLLRYYLTCGNRGCRCHRARRYRHGPYWYVVVSYAGRRQRRYLLPAGQVSRARQGIMAYEKLWKSLCRVSEINLDLLRGKGK